MSLRRRRSGTQANPVETETERGSDSNATLRGQARLDTGPPPGVSLAPPPPWARAGRVAILAGSDGIALILAGIAAFLLWAYPVHGQDPAMYAAVTPAITLILLGYAQAGLYPGFGLGPVEILRRYVLVTGTTFLILAALIFGLKVEDQFSRMTVGIGFVLSLVFIGVLRWLVTRGARRWEWWPEPVVLVGEGGGSGLARRLLEGHVHSEFRPVGVLKPTSLRAPQEGDDTGTFRSEASEGNQDAVRYAQAGIEVALTEVDGPDAEATLDRLRLIFPRVVVLRGFEGLPVEGVQIRNLGGVLGLEYGNNLLRRQNRWIKRALDLGVASVLLLFTAPVVALAMLGVKLLSPGPAVFRQEREGRRGERIRVPKIRTMVVDAERRMGELLRDDPKLRDEWEGSFKLQDDPRIIPKVGLLLRRFSIDELPQLWSVLRGDMSLVGPRPFPAYHLEALSEQARRLRSEVRPGITGLWQVTARGDADVEAQQAYDVYYIRNWSLWLDLYILARTLGAVISGRGAY